jgi:hypothetical protein
MEDAMFTATEKMATSLFADGYAYGEIADTPLVGVVGTPAWQEFADSYNNLERDTYMADGGKYRYRRYAEFDCAATGEVALLPHVAYEQTKEINYLNGGVKRLFAPFEPHAATGEVIPAVLGWAAQMFSGRMGTPSWRAQCFMNRILARPDEAGRPTPEGVHRDGVDWVLTMMVGRHNVTGGVSAIYAAGDTERPLFEVELTRPGQLLLNDDETTLHGVTPIVPGSLAGQGHRDVFIAIFTAQKGAVA